MPVALLPPTMNSGIFGTPDADIHTTGMRYVRGGGMSRWHRVRSSYTYRTEERTVYHLWCGQHASHDPGRNQLLLTVDEIGDGLPACGPCVGKALGAGQDEVPAGLPTMRFDPRWLTPPSQCPGGQSDMHVELSQSVARCLVCGELTPLRGYGGSPYYACAGVGPTKHTPGPDLVEPCPWHAWRHLRLIGPEKVGCGCGWHGGRSGDSDE